MAIVATGFSLAAYGVSQGVNSARERHAGRDLMLELRQARTLALARDEPVLVDFDLQRRCYRGPGQGERCLPDGMSLSLTTADGLSPRVSVIAFYPDGTSSGGHVSLYRGDKAWRIDIAWLTGRAVLESNSH
ncbi:type II secretion system protein GspH [Pseudomonas daroniae]|nr:type II secretion system protein GspH [Pseudomonas daroniae]